MSVEETELTTEPTELAAPAEAAEPTEATPPTREDLIAAAREASTGAAPAQAPAATPPAPADDPDEKIASVLKAREAAHAKRREADDYAAEIRRQAEEHKRQLIEEARAEAKRIAAEELAAERAKWRANPTATAAALAGNPTEFVDAILRDGTPEARALAKLQEEAAAAREDAKAGKTAAEELRAFREQLQQQQHQAHVEKVRTEFLSTVASPEKAPYMHARWEPQEVFDRCDQLTREWQRDGLRLGVDFDAATVAAYLEKQSRERFTSRLGTPAQQSGVGAPATAPGIAPKSAANGTRTITTAGSSERRASPKPFNEMTPAEQREDLLRVAREAYRAHSKT
jgi:F0F1-type ATP synthase membrane subunit b/b'